jgi:hypothetical protein
VYRLTQNRTQALEPLLRNGILYYQGYDRQRFRIFRQTATFDAAVAADTARDSLPEARPKKLDYAKAAESGEPGVKKVAWYISPFLNLSPQFLDDTTLTDLYLDLGLQAGLGPVTGGLTQSFSGYLSQFLSNRADLSAPLDYGAAYGGSWDGVTAWHQRFGWTPNLTYGLSRDVRHQNYDFHVKDTVPSNLGADLVERDVRIQDQITYRYDMAYGFMQLPLSGLRVGPGFLNLGWYGRYWNQDLVYDLDQNATLTNLRTGQRERLSQPLHLLETSVHRHFYHDVGIQWVAPAFGTPLPRHIGVFALAGKWDTRYATGLVPTDSITASLALLQNKPVPLYQMPKSDFGPWQTHFGWFGSWSQGRWMRLSLDHQAGFFTQKFPMITDTLTLSPGRDTVARMPHPNLWVMPYRLGLNLMPGYPYRFQYRGRDIL